MDRLMSTPASSRAPRLRLALQPLFVKLYKLLGIAALAIILVGLVFYVVVNIFYFLNHTWVRPVILSPRHDKVQIATRELGAAEQRLAVLEVERARTTAELAKLERTIAASQAFEAEMGPAITAAGHGASTATARRELDRAVLDRQAAADDKLAATLSASTLDRQITEQKAQIARLNRSYYLKARQSQVVVGFVPYDNLDNARPGTTLYRCKWGLLRCSAVGKVVSILEGEVTENHPHSGGAKRGVMVELHLTDATAGEDNVLFAGSKPFWIL